MRGFSLVAASGDHSSSRCAGLSLSRPLLLRSTGSRRAGSVVVAHGLSCSAACGILPDQGSNPCPQHWQADSQPLRHQGSPTEKFWLQFTMWFFFLNFSCRNIGRTNPHSANSLWKVQRPLEDLKNYTSPTSLVVPKKLSKPTWWVFVQHCWCPDALSP